MPISTAFHRKFLMAFIVSILLCGLVGIYVLLLGRFGRLESQVLATTGSVGAASILGMAAAVAWERRRWQPLAPLALGTIVCALLLTVGAIWNVPDLWRDWRVYSSGPPPPYYYERITATAALIGVALSHIALLSLARLRKQYEWSRIATVATIATLVALCLVLLWGSINGFGEEALLRAVGVLAILVACGTVAVPVLHRVSAIRRREDIRTVELKLPITCPRCRKAQELPVGRSRCACGLRFAIEIEEEHCAVCGYALYNLTGNCCPECGTPIGAEQRAPTHASEA
jgi:hypothetical protein